MLTHDMMLNFTQNETATDVINIVKPRFALLSSFVGRNSYWNVAGELKFSTLLLFYVIYSVKEKRVSHKCFLVRSLAGQTMLTSADRLRHLHL